MCSTAHNLMHRINALIPSFFERRSSLERMIKSISVHCLKYTYLLLLCQISGMKLPLVNAMQQSILPSKCLIAGYKCCSRYSHLNVRPRISVLTTFKHRSKRSAALQYSPYARSLDGSNSTRIVRAATLDEMVLTDSCMFEAFGRGLTQEQWLDRQRRLRDHPWSKKCMQTWVMVNGSGNILASCSFFRMESVVDSSNIAGDAGYSIAFASVFVEEQFRGLGYAVEMMKKVVAQLQNHRIHSFVLYSAVGAKIYSKLGFAPCRGFERYYNLQNNSPLCNSSDVAELFTRADFKSIWEDAKEILPTLAPYKIIPTYEQMDWHLAKHDLYSGYFGRPVLRFRGARIAKDFILWGPDYNDDALVVHYFRCSDPSHAVALMDAALEYAKMLGLRWLTAWEEEEFRGWDTMLGPYYRSERRAREACIPMILPVSDGLEPSHWSIISYSMFV